MKKMLKALLVLLMVFTIFPTKIWAEEKNIVIDFSKITCEWDISVIQEEGLGFLEDNGILIRSNEDNSTYYSNSNGKQLITENRQNNKIEIADGVGESDNIEYTLTEEDKNSHKVLKSYNKIILKFGKANFDATDYVILVEEGKSFYDFSESDLVGAMRIFPQKGILIFSEEVIISSLSEKKLFTYSLNMEDTNFKTNIPNDVTEEDDITYLVTEEAHAKSREIYSNDIFSNYDKVIVNFSGKDYSNETDTTLVINMSDFSQDSLSNNDEMIIEFLSIQNVIKMSKRLILQNLEGKDLAYYELYLQEETLYVEDEYEYFSKLVVQIPDGVGEEDTIIYELDDELKAMFPENYQRLVIKFIPKEKENTTTPANSVLVNPKTFNNILIVLGMINLVLIGTIIPKLKRK